MTAIVDYGVGNLFSIESALSYLGIKAALAKSKADIQNADRIILPGVGAFKDAAIKLFNSGLVEEIENAVTLGVPLLGICLGMQLLFSESNEYGKHKGLNLIKGTVEPLCDDIANKELKIPHIGWNKLEIIQNDKIFQYIKNDSYVYYVHSFYAKNCAESTLAVSEYSMPVTAVVKNNNVYGMQFHPEKSGETGLSLLRAFSEI